MRPLLAAKSQRLKRSVLATITRDVIASSRAKVQSNAMIAAYTKFQLHSLKLYPRFFAVTYRATKQARGSDGLIHFKINPITLETLTLWKSRKAMMAYVTQGAHMEAMKQQNHFGDISSSSWECDEIPSWQAARQVHKG